jgi:aminopeptidase N
LPKALSGADSFKLKFIYIYPFAIGSDSIYILDRGHRWYPIIADKISKIKIKCELPSGFEALSSGIITRKKYYDSKSVFEWETKFPVFKGTLIVFKENVYKEFRCDLTGNIISFYYFPDDSLDVKKIITETGRMMNFCGSYVGEYKYEKLTMIEIPGLEGINIGSGLLMIGSKDLDYLNKGYQDGLLLTLAEQWFGAGVFSKYGGKGFWITSLSLPHYIRMLYLKDTYGLEKFNDALVKPLEKYKEFAGGEKDMALYDVNMPDTPEKAMLLYIKGPYIFHKLHEKMDDDQWRTFVRELYSGYFGKVMPLEDFVSELKKYDKDGSLFEYFNKLITQKGMPE